MSAISERLSAALADRYRIERELGQGGMATVFLAEDLKHKRRVALKVLKPELAAVLGAERFVQEITTTAALQHPHILPLFDSGTADGFLYYVMPFIDGETLRDKLNRETQLGVDEAVRVAIDVAEALHYAHTQGVIHRDIKPENILLANGRPMVADFGIALAVSAAAGGRMTETGLSLGTPHYMSPEQATAEKEISARSDVYSLASVLYEMLAGQPPHLGGSAQQIIMKIIAEQPAAVMTLRKSVPPHVAAALAKALERLPADRFESAAKFAEALSNPAFVFTAGDTRTSAGHAATRTWNHLTIAMTAVAATLALLLAMNAGARDAVRTADAPVVRFALGDDPSLRISTVFSRSFALSPDGRTIVFQAATDSTAPKLWVRTIGDTRARPLEGTEGGNNAAISPDGEWIVYYGFRSLHKVRVTGGEVTQIATLPAVAAAITWISNDEVLYEQLIANGTLPIQRVKVNGGTPSVAIPLDTAAGETSQRKPLLMPHTDVVVYTSTTPGQTEGAELVFHRLSDGRRERIGIPGGALALIDDRLVYSSRDGTLLAVQVDLREMRTIGAPVTLEPRVAAGSTGTTAGLSEGGTLVYRLAGARTVARLDLVDTSGSVRRIPGTFSVQGRPRFSPNGQHVVVGLGVEGARGAQFGIDLSDLWVVDIATGVQTRLTSDNNGTSPTWFPDGRSVVYMAAVGRGSEMRSVPVDGSAPPSRLVEIGGSPTRAEILPDRSAALVLTIPSAVGITTGLYRVPLAAGMPIDTIFVASGVGVRPTEPRVSPDGRWVAYTDRTNFDVWVRSLTGTTAMQVSVTGSAGNPVVWGPDSRRLYYATPDGLVMIELETSPTLSVKQRRTLHAFPPNEGYDLSPNGRTFVVVSPVRHSADIFVAVNWADEARRAWRAAELKP